MSDSTPPRPKPGSLRDRIAAFETQASQPSGPAPPPPRPKPAGLQWKPRQPSPPANDHGTNFNTSPGGTGAATATSPGGRPSIGGVTTSNNTSSSSGGGMSASDARDSIRQGASLKERMAALKGKGAFGGSPVGGGTGGGQAQGVQTPPTVQRPKWKPPPQVPVVPAEGDEGENKEKDPEEAAAVEKETPRDDDELGKAGEDDVSATANAAASTTTVEGGEESEQGSVDPEEEERQRRAAIAARMARLGGARVGMAAPALFGGARPPPPPVSKKPEVRKESIPAPAPAPVEEKEGTTIESTAASAASPPPASEPTEATEKVESTPETKAEISTGSPTAQSRSPPSMPVPAVPRRTAPPRRKPPKSPVPPPPEAEPEAVTEAEAAVVEAQERQEVLKDVEPLTKEERRQVEIPPVEEVETTENLVAEMQIAADEEVEEPSQIEATGEEELVQEDEVGVTAAEAEEAEHEKVDAEFVEEPETQESEEQEQVQEEAEDEEAKRKRIAERIAKMGGVNPFAAPPIPKRTMSTTDEGEPVMTSPGIGTWKRRSVDSVSSGGLVKRTSVGSVKEVEYRVMRELPKQGEDDDKVEEEEEEESADALAASIIMERPHKPESGTVPTRRSSGFITRSSEIDDERGPTDEEAADEQERAPLPVSPRISSIPPRRMSYGSHLTETAESDESGHDTKPVPVPHRAPSLRSVQPGLAKHSEVDEEEEYEENQEEQEDFDEGECVEEEEEQEVKEVKHVPPPPPTRRVPLPPPALGLEDEEPEQEDHQDQYEQDSPLVPGSAQSDEPLVIPPPTVGRRLSRDGPLTDLPLPHPMLVRPSLAPSVRVQKVETEVMDDEEGDPIDPSFHTPKRGRSASPGLLSRVESQGKERNKDEAKEKGPDVGTGTSDFEAVKRQTIAERMAKLGGIKFGVAPMPVPAPRQASMHTESGDEVKEDTDGGDGGEEGETKLADEEEEERARKGRIAAKLAGMGGMRIGMMPSMMGIPSRPPQRPQGSPPPAPASPQFAAPRIPPTRPPPPPQPPVSASSHDTEWEHESVTTSEEGVKVELEESELEEVHHEDARLDDENEDDEIVSPPPPPSRAQRQPLYPTRNPPPVPSTASIRRSSVGSGGLNRKASSGSTTTTGSHHPVRRQSDYVMVEEPQEYEPIEAPPPPARPAPRIALPHHPPPPPPPSAIDSISSQWELPSIPSGSFGMPTTGSLSTDLSLSWIEADESPPKSTPAPGTRSRPPAYISPPSPSAPIAATQVSPAEQNLSADDLIAVWGRVGVQVCETATAMYEKSKKTVIADGTYAGFVRAVLNEVPNAIKLPRVEGQWGYLVYSQTGSAVQRRTSDIMPGDLIELIDARFKGHKGLQSYTQHVGVGGQPLVGVVSEFEPKKSKVKVLQANQHVGQQTVELVSYKLEDLKSGTFKVYRVLEAQ